jgi:hypothetical protein
MKYLDRDVSVLDPRNAEAQMVDDFRGVSSREDAECIAAERIEKKLRSGEDVPLVEDFPHARRRRHPISSTWR